MELRKFNYFFATSEGIRDIKFYCEHYGIQTLLDYGCGFTRLGGIPDVTVSRYDPHIPTISKEPEGTYDAVVCHNALNWIRLDELNAVINHIYSLTKKIAIFNIQYPGRHRVNLKTYVQFIQEVKFNIIERTRIPLNAYERMIEIEKLTYIDPKWDIEPCVFYILSTKEP